MTTSLGSTAVQPLAGIPPASVDLPSLSLSPHSNDHDSLTHDIFRNTPIPTVLLDSSLIVRQVSDSYVDVSAGCRREQLAGLHADDFFGQKATIPSLDSARQAIRAAQETRLPYLLEHIQGASVWRVRTVPIFRHGSLWCIQMELQDTTQERQRQLELEDRLYASETYRILVETVRDYAIFMLDPQGNVATWNAGAQFFKGYTRDEIVGKHFSSFYSQEDRESGKPEKELADALQEGRVEDEGWRCRKDGSQFWANVVITPVYRGDTLLGFSKVTRDLSERRKAERELIAAYEEASKLKSEFLANMSHEIRTPMHGMLSALTLLLDTRLNPEQLDLAQVIQESGGILLQVINDILDYSKLTSGYFSLSHDIINFADIIQSILRVHQKCCKPEIVLHTYVDPLLPTAAEGDSLRYRQIVQNLMSNATKFTEEGYVRINATLQAEDDEFYTILTQVIDTGIGVPIIDSGSLFTPFTQFDNSTTKQFKGTGLGLSICKSLTELMGGNIGFHPNPEGRGSTFWFTAKLKKVNHLKTIDALQEKFEELAIPNPTLPATDIRLAAVDKRILLAEDNTINQKVMLKMLAGLGFDNVDLATNGEEAVTLSTKDSLPYHIILMDINMPLLDGITATKKIRDAGIHTPIVAMTANALKGQGELYITKGMDAYIPKPVDRNLLVKVLLGCLKNGGLG